MAARSDAVSQIAKGRHCYLQGNIGFIAKALSNGSHVSDFLYHRHSDFLRDKSLEKSYVGAVTDHFYSYSTK